MRSKPGQHLSQSGVSLARQIGDGNRQFDLVVTSDLSRAIETAIAMGLAVDRLVPELGVLPENIFRAIEWPNALANISRIANNNENCRAFAAQQGRLWRSVFGELAGDQSALIVTHGGIIELGAIGFLPDADHAAWGDAIGYCEGFKFTSSLDGIRAEILRAPAPF